MVFSSFGFLCFFLPVIFALHTVLPGMKAKNILLTAASVLFYAYGEPVFVLLLLLSVAVHYLLGRMLEAKHSRLPVILAVVLDLAALAVFKYAGLLTGTVNLLLPAAFQLPIPQIRLPIGISFYTFQALSYVIDVYRGKTQPQRSFWNLLLYISFFPQLIAGPIVQYRDVAEQIEARTADPEQMKRGAYRFACGLGKKVLIANVMAVAADAVFALPDAELGLLSAWLGAVAYLFQIYFDFSGYSDMAIGLGLLFGFRFRENFDYPYIAASVREFWKRWHLSLTSWFREYLYIPLGGNRRGKARTVLNRYLVFLATGIWHGASWTYLLWGLYHGTLQMVESALPENRKRIPALGHVYTLLAVLIGFVLFRAESLPQTAAFLAAMLGFGATGGAGLQTALRLLDPYFCVFLGIAAVGATPLPAKLFRAFADRCKHPAVPELLSMLLSVCVLLLCLMALASQSYNPFIYFRF